MKKRGYIIGASSIAVGMLSMILMFFTFLRRTTSTVASARITRYNSFQIMNFNGVWSLKVVSILQIVLIVFAVSAIAVGILKIFETLYEKNFGADECVMVSLSILAFVGICLIFFAVLYCKFSNRVADTEIYKVSYKVFVAPFIQVASVIVAYAVSSMLSNRNKDEELASLALADEGMVETEGDVEQDGEVVVSQDEIQVEADQPEDDDGKKEG